MSIEKTIINNLLCNEEYTRKVLPFFDVDYFEQESTQLIFKTIKNYVDQYNTIPSIDAVEIELDSGINEKTHKEIDKFLKDLTGTPSDLQWILDKSEKFCQDRALQMALYKAIEILDNKEKKITRGMIPELLQDALSISFETNIGHDYFEDAAQRHDVLHNKLNRIPFDIQMLNQITRGGFGKKTLNILLAGTNVGKTALMCHMAAANIIDGQNVLYITLEMSKENIGQRIDANLLNIPIGEVEDLPKDDFLKRVERIKRKCTGKLIIQEYPTSGGSVAHFRTLLRELKLKKNFVPDVVYIDYINICASSRYKPGILNSYGYVKAIAEEIRGLAVEYNFCAVSATQLNRSGSNNSSPEMTDTADSFGLPMTVDFMCCIIRNAELDRNKKLLVKQLKSRYRNKFIDETFEIGVDMDKMRLYDADVPSDYKVEQEFVDTKITDDNLDEVLSKFL